MWWRVAGGVLLLFSGALLVAILGPVIASARVASRMAGCMQNEKAILIGLEVYANDNSDHCPPGATWADLADRQIDPTLDRASLWHCPAANSQFSYALNRNMASTSLTELENPGQTVLLFECDATSKNAMGLAGDLPERPRHGVDVFGFADGRSRMQNRESRVIWRPK